MFILAYYFFWHAPTENVCYNQSGIFFSALGITQKMKKKCPEIAIRILNDFQRTQAKNNTSIAYENLIWQFNNLSTVNKAIRISHIIQVVELNIS